MSRLLAVAYDLTAESPAQPRLAALFRHLQARGVQVELWTERPSGDWPAAAGGVPIGVHVVCDPVLGVYRSLGGPRRGTAAARRTALGLFWQLGRRVQLALLFPDQQRVWSRRVARRMLGAVRPGDVVLTCARPESAATIGRAAQRRGARWWLDFADGWCFQGLRPEAMAPGARRERELALERELVSAADLVSTVDDELAGYFATLRRAGDVAVFPNIVPDELADLPPLVRTRPAGASPTIGYFGRLSLSDPERSLAPLLRLLRAAGATAPLARFRFHGDYTGRDLGEIDELRALGHAVQVAPPVPRAALAAMRAEFDAALMVASPRQRGSSSKLLDTLGLGLPVLALVPVPSVAARIVGEAGCGEVVELQQTAGDGDRWPRFVSRLGDGAYRVDPAVRARYTSAAVVPALVERIAHLFGARGALSVP